MTKNEALKNEALKMALHALERGETVLRWEAIAAIKEALAQQDAEAHLQAISDFGQLQEQEPVAHMKVGDKLYAA